MPTLLLLAVLAAPHLDPAGIPGEVVLVGDKLPDAGIDYFATRAGGKDAKVVVLVADKDGGLFDKLKGKVSAEKRPFKADELTKASAVWIVGSDAAELSRQFADVEKDCATVLKRGGVVAFSGAATSLGANLLPDMAFGKSAKGGMITCELPRDAALSVRNRLMRSVAGKVTLRLAAGNRRPERIEVLSDRKVQDLTALRRSARARAGKLFPPAKPPVPFVEKGTLIIVGGGGMPKGLIQKFFDLAGGKKAKIVVLPTAVPGRATRNGMANALRKLGATVTLLPGRIAKEVESKEYLEAMKEATGIWFDGGRQWRFVDAYENTKLLPLMHDVLKRGGVIAGSSAGATIQGDYLCRGGVFDNSAIMYEGYERGFAFLPGVGIDQHFAQRKRFGDMVALMKQFPQLLGIGLDEATAIIVKGSRADVVGRGSVHFYPGKTEPLSLKDGAAYDLKLRAEIKPNSK